MILIVGGDGQLGRSLNDATKSMSYSCTSLNRKELDITDRISVSDVVKDINPDIVINCAAWTNVDEAEKYPKEATAINAFGALNLAEASKSVKARFFQISTDYVFSGEKQEPWGENDTKFPLSKYGLSKSMGEDFVLESYPENSVIIRTSWLYGLSGNNFLTKILEKIEKKEKNVKIVSDQIGQPTLVTDLAERIVSMLDLKLNSNIYHATNTGYVSWFDFAKMIYSYLGESSSHVLPIQSREFNSPATRPAFSILGQTAWVNSGLTPMRNWQEALAELLSRKEINKGVRLEN